MPTDKPTELELLCRWLNSDSNRKNNKSDQMFSAYYNAIRKKLLPHLKYSLGLTDTGLAEEFFHDVMVKIIERPQIAKRIEELTRELDVFDLNNPFLKKRTHTWTNDVRHWVEEAISFPLEHSQTKSPELDDKIEYFNGKMNPLKNEGIAILDWLADNLANIQEKEFIEITTNIIGMPKTGKQKKKPNLLSKICIPTSALLKTMATNKAKDHWKKHSTKFETVLKPDKVNENKGKQGSKIEGADSQGHLNWFRQQNQGIANETDNVREDIEFLLQAPIRNAETQLREATGKQEIQRCENRLDKARINYIKHQEILAMIESKYTQEQMADNLGLTRDQIRPLLPQIKVLIKLLK
jgi:DNA-directed RNA polymerase specialized sigma24 family protein